MPKLKFFLTCTSSALYINTVYTLFMPIFNFFFFIDLHKISLRLLIVRIEKTRKYGGFFLLFGLSLLKNYPSGTPVIYILNIMCQLFRIKKNTHI